MSDLHNLRLVFAGTPAFAASHLAALLDAGVTPVAVYTQPDRPAGRGKKLAPGPVKQLALDAGLPVYQPQTLRDSHAQAELAALAPDVLVVVAYGLILPQPVLDIPAIACINVHGSLLPRWRGAAPIQRAIEAGDPVSGITIMQMEAGLDTGPMLARREIEIHENTSAGDLHDALAILGPELLLEVLNDLPGALAQAEKQNDADATYASKIEKAEAELAWMRPAAELARQIAAFNPFPGCWTTVDGQRLKLWRARVTPGQGKAGTILSAGNDGIAVACGEGALLVTELQLPGGKALPAAQLLNSRADQFAPGTRLGS